MSQFMHVAFMVVVLLSPSSSSPVILKSIPMEDKLHGHPVLVKRNQIFVVISDRDF